MDDCHCDGITVCIDALLSFRDKKVPPGPIGQTGQGISLRQRLGDLCLSHGTILTDAGSVWVGQTV